MAATANALGCAPARAVGLVAVVTAGFLLLAAACGVDGTTPQCGGDAGCGPPASEGGPFDAHGFDAGGVDARPDVASPVDAADASSPDAPPG